MDIREKAAKLVGECNEVILASVSEDGRPRPCVLAKIASEGIGSFHISTGMIGTKARHFKQNPKAGACFWRGGDSVTLMGEVAFIDDMERTRALWQDWFIDHFPGGPEDPNYAVIRFEAMEATIWIDGEFETIAIGGGQA